jgi:hypothetical protein
MASRWQKLLIVTLLKKHTSMTNKWIANRLEMGHPAGMRKAKALYRTSKEGAKSIAAYEKIVTSKDPIDCPP